jgi:hypothetical protein
MTRALRVAGSWLDSIENTTLWCVATPTRRWSWFQVTWAGLHAIAVVMHIPSTIYHMRRVNVGRHVDRFDDGPRSPRASMKLIRSEPADERFPAAS